MTPEQKQKIEAAAIEHHDENCEGYGVGPRTSFEMGATFGISLANEPVGDDEKEAVAFADNTFGFYPEGTDWALAHGSFLAGRMGCKCRT